MKLKRILIFLFIIILLSLLSFYYPKLTGKSISDPQNYEKEPAFVIKVVDGDTIHVNINDKEEVVRLLGINNKGV